MKEKSTIAVIGIYAWLAVCAFAAYIPAPGPQVHVAKICMSGCK